MTEYLLGLTRLLGHGRAFSEVLTVPSPAAGAGFTYTNDGRYWELLDSLSFKLVSDANAANRQVAVAIADGSGVALATLPAASVQAASLTYSYTYSADLSSFNTVVGLAVTAPFPTLFIQPGYSVAVTVGSVQVGDQISNIRLYAQRFQTGPGGYFLGMVTEDDPAVNELVDLATLAS